MARPTIYNQGLAREFCERLAQGKSMRKVCLDDDMPEVSTIFEWIHNKPEFSKQYEYATTERSEAQHEELLETGDEAVKLAQSVNDKVSNAVVQAMKLKADNMKWSMARMKPKKYGDKLDMTTNGKDIPAPLYGGKSTKEI